MEMKLELVPYERKEVIDHLMQFYLYDFTSYLDMDVNARGKFDDYPDLEMYWNHKDGKYAYLITYFNKPAGFALVEELHNPFEGEYYMTEFFIMKKYRRTGLGTWAANELFQRFKGNWKVTQVSSNTPAQAFWQKVISAYTGGDFRQKTRSDNGNLSQYFKS